MIRRSGLVGLTLVFFGLQQLACSSEFSDGTTPDGGAGSAGSAGSAGTAGQGGSAGSAGTAGQGGSAGTAGQGGSAGTAGQGGSAGSAGAGAAAGSGGDAGSGGVAGAGGSGGSGGVSCEGQPDGTACGEALEQICVGGACAQSHCGDGYVDATAGEDCDDGNELSGDGCSACKYDCTKDAECDDGNPCTVNSCASHKCAATNVTAVTVCAMAGGGEGTCKNGVCAAAGCGDGVKNGSEDCDDGNATNGDGCDNDCTFSCTKNADCDDGDACTGAETCNTTTHQCQAGTAVTCSKPATCATAGTCNPGTGSCSFADLDGDGVTCDTDCNDADPTIYPGAPECKDGKDNDCNQLKEDTVDCVCYADSDKDGYALASASSISASTCPSGYTNRKPDSNDPTTLDCKEGNASVFPSQTTYFQSSYCAFFRFGPPPNFEPICNKYSFDYNCDGAETQHYTAKASSICSVFSGPLFGCKGSGWVGDVPACGASGTYKSCSYNKLSQSCTSSTAARVQDCR